MSDYCIVKFASKEYWKYHWHEDPKITGVHFSYSAYNTYSGKDLLQEKYSESELEIAKEHVKKINKINPSGGYAICKIID